MKINLLIKNIKKGVHLHYEIIDLHNHYLGGH